MIQRTRVSSIYTRTLKTGRGRGLEHSQKGIVRPRKDRFRQDLKTLSGFPIYIKSFIPSSNGQNGRRRWILSVGTDLASFGNICPGGTMSASSPSRFLAPSESYVKVSSNWEMKLKYDCVSTVATPPAFT